MSPISAILFFSALMALSLADYFNQGPFTGDVTYYTFWNQGYGSCGRVDSMSNPYMVAALSPRWMADPTYEPNPNKKTLCQDQYCLNIQGPRGSVNVKVSDTCMGCKDQDVDVADAIYSQLAPIEQGRVRMTWKFVDCASHPPGPA